MSLFYKLQHLRTVADAVPNWQGMKVSMDVMLDYDDGDSRKISEYVSEACKNLPMLLEVIDTLSDALEDISSEAHNFSTGPSIPDGYWKISTMAMCAMDKAYKTIDGKQDV